MVSLYLMSQMREHYIKNEQKYIKEHPGEFMVLTTDFQEFFFKTELDREKFLNPEKIKAIKRWEKPRQELMFGTPPLCKIIPSPKNPRLKQPDLPLDLRI